MENAVAGLVRLYVRGWILLGFMGSDGIEQSGCVCMSHAFSF